jgi:transcriptional regulator EpsA
MLDEIEHKTRVTEQWQSFLEPEDRDRLVWIAEAGLKVESQSAFFLWSQGALQMLVPHEIMLCGIRPVQSRPGSLQFIRYSSSRYFRDEHFASVCEPQSGLMSQLVARWVRGAKPCFCLPGDGEDTDRALAESELKNIASHGVLAPDAETSAYFSFSRTTLLRDARAVRILELVTPIVYVTFARVLASDAAGAGNGARAPQVVSDREVEILALIKEGETTLAIAQSLGLSPFTVKNHVQNILRKLGARTRSHAVAQAINLGLLHSS